MSANPKTVILLDEPDAHLEILRQRQIYEAITELAAKHGNQIIAASHSEVLLNEAAGKDLVVAFVGNPHRIDGRSSQVSQVRKALSQIGFDQYLQAELTGWVLYLEGSTDLKILRAFAKLLGKAAAVQALERPFVRYVGNRPKKAEEHFFGLRQSVPKLRGLAVFDRLEQGPPKNEVLKHLAWTKREIENYLCTEKTLESFARFTGQDEAPGTLFEQPETDKRVCAMREAIEEVTKAMRTLGKGSPWDADTKVSDDFLTPLFKVYYGKLELPNLMEKKAFYELAQFVPEEETDPEICSVLEEIVTVSGGNHDACSPDQA